MRIHLRERYGKISEEKINKGTKRKISLYLAFQAPGKRTKYEWLKLYLVDNQRSILDKEHNKETKKLAETIKAKRMLDFQTTSNGFIINKKGKIGFLDYFQHLAVKKQAGSKGNGGNWKSTLEHLKVFCNGQDYTIEQIDDNFLEGFKQYLFENVSRRGEGKNQSEFGVSIF